MVYIWKRSGGDNVHVESLDFDGARCEITENVSLETGFITSFSIAVFGFSDRSSAYARAMARVLEEAARELDRLAAEYIGVKNSDFTDMALTKHV